MKTIIRSALLLSLLSTLVHASPSLMLAAVSLDEATRLVRQDSRLKVLGAKTETIDGREVHVIKVLTPDGRIQHQRIDAETGQFLGREQ